MLFYLIASLFALPSLANMLQPQLIGLLFAIVNDVRYYYMLVMVPLAALIPDITMNLITQVFYPRVEDILMYMQSEMAG